MYFLDSLKPPYEVLENCSFPGLAFFPKVIGDIVSIVYMGIRVGVPIILLIAGMIDLMKAITAQKEDDIKKAQSLLFKKLVVAIIIFAFFTLVQFAINIVDGSNNSNNAMWNCVNALLGNK